MTTRTRLYITLHATHASPIILHSHLRLDLPIGIPQVSPLQSCAQTPPPFLAPMRAICQAHPIFLDLIARITPGLSITEINKTYGKENSMCNEWKWTPRKCVNLQTTRSEKTQYICTPSALSAHSCAHSQLRTDTKTVGHWGSWFYFVNLILSLTEVTQCFLNSAAILPPYQQ